MTINTRGGLPAPVANAIIEKVKEQSAVMRLARQIQVPARGATVPVVTSDPTAAWVAEGSAKTNSNPTVSYKLLQPYKLAVIELFSDELVRDEKALFDALIDRLPMALGTKFDNTVIGGTAKPGDNFDNFASATKVDISANTYTQLVSADTTIATAGGILNGFALAPQGRGILLGATDDNGRPLFINNTAEGAIPMVLGAKTVQNKGLYKTDASGNFIGIAGDWTKAVYGTVNGVEIKMSKEATVGEVNCFESNLTAVLAEIEIGFRADTSCFCVLTD